MSKHDEFRKTINDLFGQYADTTNSNTYAIKLETDILLLRDEVAALKTERKRWFMLLAAILKEHGEMRVSERSQKELDKPVITVEVDPATGGLLIKLKS